MERLGEHAVLEPVLPAYLELAVGGRRVVDEATGLVGAGLAAAYGYFVYYSAALMTETFFITLVLFSLHMSLELKERPTLGRWILLGLALVRAKVKSRSSSSLARRE